jgi:hypothetical protein
VDQFAVPFCRRSFFSTSTDLREARIMGARRKAWKTRFRHNNDCLGAQLPGHLHANSNLVIITTISY